MADVEYMTEKIEKYIDNIKTGHKVQHTLKRLGEMEMTVDLLTKTGVGKVVNRLSREDPVFADMALRIVSKWKETAQNHQARKERSPSPVQRKVKQEVKDEEPSNGYPDESSYARPSSSSSAPNGERKRKVKEEPIGGGYGDEERRREEKKKSKPAAPAPVANSFLAALSSGDNVKVAKPKKLKPFDLSLDIDPNYRPMPSINIAKSSTKSDEPFDPTQMFKPRVGQTKIFAGRKKAATLTEVPRLFDCCIRVLQNHIGDIESFGSIPYDIIKPILEKCTWHQLYDIERRNQYLEEDTGELWERLAKKHHPGKPTTRDESWKEMFMRCEHESANRLKMLSERISQHGSAAQDKIRKAVAITDIKMPKKSRSRMPTCAAIIDMPSALQVSKARKEIFESGSKSQLSTLPSTVQNRSSTLGSSSHRRKEMPKSGPKKGALMAKTLKMLGKKRV